MFVKASPSRILVWLLQCGSRTSYFKKVNRGQPPFEYSNLIKKLILKLVNSFWLMTIEIMVSEGEEKSNTASGSDTEIYEDKTKGYDTTRHGSHLTKTTEGVAESEDVEGKKT